VKSLFCGATTDDLRLTDRFEHHSYEDPLKQTDEIKSKLDQNLEISTDVQARLARLEHLLATSQSRARSPPRNQAQQLDISPRLHNPYQGYDSQFETETEPGPGLKGRITQGSYFGTSAMATVEQPGPLDPGDHVRTRRPARMLSQEHCADSPLLVGVK
jgi:hypothetical protein